MMWSEAATPAETEIGHGSRRAVLRRRSEIAFIVCVTDEVGGFQANTAISARAELASGAINIAGVVELVDTQDLGSCAFGCEGSNPSFGTGRRWP